jgi:phosphoglycerate dehydrogenase-like enzyme
MNRPAPRDTKLVMCVQFHFSFWRIPPELPAAVQRRWPEMRVVHLNTYDALPAELPDTDIFVGVNLLRDQLAAARKLKWIHVTSAGVTQLMRPDVQAAGVVITNSRGIHAVPMAEHTLGVMLALARKFPATVRFQDKQDWAQQEIWDSRPSELFGVTLLIVGFGAIGSEIARRARAFGMRVQAVTRSGRGDNSLPERIYPASELLQALPQADYVVLAAPDTPETQRMIGARELKAMKPSAYLLNIARGALVDESALIDALERGAIAGAALDVTEKEPLPPESPLWNLKNVFITPHTSAVSELLWLRQTELLLENLERWFSGRDLKNIVDITRGY